MWSLMFLTSGMVSESEDRKYNSYSKAGEGGASLALALAFICCLAEVEGQTRARRTSPWRPSLSQLSLDSERGHL